jgi:hypothetical protein
MGDCWVVPLLHSVCDMTSRDARVAATAHSANCKYPVSPEIQTQLPFLPSFCTAKAYGQSPSTGPPRVQLHVPAALSPKPQIRVQTRKIPLPHIGIRSADRPARSLIALVLFLFDAFVAWCKGESKVNQPPHTNGVWGSVTIAPGILKIGCIWKRAVGRKIIPVT